MNIAPQPNSPLCVSFPLGLWGDLYTMGLLKQLSAKLLEGSDDGAKTVCRFGP